MQKHGWAYLNDTSYDVSLRKQLPLGIEMIAIALIFLVALIFKIAINSLTRSLTALYYRPSCGPDACACLHDRPNR